MYFLNLSVAQFVVLFGSISAVAVALYLLDRSRRRQIVSTLRFWVAAEQPAVAARRRRVQQPWSLLLQLVSMALILLAIAQVRFGAQAQAPRDHVILLETSSWMAARSGNRTLMDLARERARGYLRAIPMRDRVMLVRADALTTPATAFEPDRRKIEDAIAASEPGSTALNLDQALTFARRIQQQGGRRIGEVAFIGSGRTTERDPGTTPPAVGNLRFIAVPDAIENAGLRKVGLRRSNADPDIWEIYVSVHNYGAAARAVNLALEFGLPGPTPKAAVGSRRVNLPAGGDGETTFEYRTRAAGVLSVALFPRDAFPADDRAELELPAQPSLAVTVYSEAPDLLRPVLSANTRLNAVYRKTSEYKSDDRGLVILDRFIPPRRPAADSIWIDPPAQGSPVAVKSRAANVPLVHWNSNHVTAEGLHIKDYRLDAASVLTPSEGDIIVGEVAGGPVIVARPSTPKLVVLGFHPGLSGMRYELATPLLFANLIRWTSPEIFRRWELSGGSVGAVKVALDADIPPGAVKVLHEDGTPLPFTLQDRSLSLFAGTPGRVRVLAGDREYVYSLTLPQLGETRWDPPADARRGVPRPSTMRETPNDLWPWFALAGGFGLFLEWLIYGRFRRAILSPLSPRLLRWKERLGVAR
jgi:hypothetical protein